MADAAAENARPNRMSRQRQKTRERLIDAALKVMAEKGTDAATIADITETADVGFGSFYNHFSSKEEIFAVAAEELFERIGNLIDSETGSISDPREALAAAIRLFVAIMIGKLEWAKFIIRVCLVPDFQQITLYQRLFRDMEKVLELNRSRTTDAVAATYSVSGAITFMIIAMLDGNLPASGAPDRIAAMVLRILGEKEDKISKFLARPLPVLPGDLPGSGTQDSGARNAKTKMRVSLKLTATGRINN